MIKYSSIFDILSYNSTILSGILSKIFIHYTNYIFMNIETTL